MDGGAWRATVHGVAKSRTRLSDFTFKLVKNLPAMQETQETGVRSLGQEDSLEEEMVTHSQYSCLGNPTDRRALLATVHGVTRVRHD